MLCSYVSAKAMFPRRAGKAASGPVPAEGTVKGCKSLETPQVAFKKIVRTCVGCLISDICGIKVELVPATASEKPKSRLSHSASDSFQPNCSELRLSGPPSSPFYPFLCLLSSLSLKAFCLLSACILVTGMSKHISCGVFQRHQPGPPTELSSRHWRLTFTLIWRLFPNPGQFTLSEQIGAVTSSLTNKLWGLGLILTMKGTKVSVQASSLLLRISFLC